MKNLKRVIWITLAIFLVSMFAYGWYESVQGATDKVKDRRTVTSYGFTTGQVTCTVATTKYPIPVEAEVISVKALSTNTGLIYVGDSTTASAAAGYELSRGESIDIGSKGTYFAGSIIYVTAVTGGDKVCWARLN
jgi:hypothetical protein